MADMQLRRRLGAAAGLALDDDLLDMIHTRLMLTEGKGKIPVTVKYEFEVGDTGELDVTVKSSTAMPLHSVSLRLSSDGSQLTLYDTPVSTKDGVEEPEPAQEVAMEDPAPPAPTPPARPSPFPSQAERIAQIQAQNEQLYREGALDRAHAMRAGVDVEKVDAEKATA